MAPTALLFDLDGTLWDSFPWYGMLVSGLGSITPGEAVSRLRNGDGIVTLGQSLGIARSKLIRVIEGAEDFPPLYPGVETSFRALSRRGLPMGIVTSLPGAIAAALLGRSRLEGHFGTVVHAGNCRVAKPNPAPILRALEGLKLEPAEDIFYVGDQSHDCQAALRAGLGFCWASYGYGVEAPSGTSVVLGRFPEVVDL